MKPHNNCKRKRGRSLAALFVISTAVVLAGHGCASKASDRVGSESQQAASPSTRDESRARTTTPMMPAIDEPAPPPPPEPTGPMPQNVPPTLLERLRVAGTPDIDPANETKDAIRKVGRRVSLAAKVCVDPVGTVQEASVLKTSGFPDYDARILEQMRSWKFKPYEVNHVPTRVCSAFTIFYPKEAPEPTIPKTEPEHLGGYWCITYAVAGVKSSGCGTDADYCDNFAGPQAALKKWGMKDRSECEWQETAWQTKIPVDGKREDWFFVERQHCEESASVYRGTPCKRLRNGSAGKRR